MWRDRPGRVERQTRRAIVARWPQHVRAPSVSIAVPERWHRIAVHRAVKRWAVVVGKTGNGYGNLWAANAELERQIRGEPKG